MVDSHLVHFVKKDDVIDNLALLEHIGIKPQAGFGITLFRTRQGHGAAHAAARQPIEPGIAQTRNPQGKVRLAYSRRAIQKQGREVERYCTPAAETYERADVVNGFPEVWEFLDQGFVDEFRGIDDRPPRQRIKQIQIALLQPFIIMAAISRISCAEGSRGYS